MNKMVIIPASAAMAKRLTFTVGQITWPTHAGGLTTTTLEETQISSETAEVVTPITPTATTTTPRADLRFLVTRGNESTIWIFLKPSIAPTTSFLKPPA